MTSLTDTRAFGGLEAEMKQTPRTEKLGAEPRRQAMRISMA